MKFDVAIVGAGIVGAACAAALARDGRRVAVFDRHGAAGGTTAAGMGHLVVMDDSEAQFALTDYSRRLWAELAGELPADCEYQNCGTIWAAADEVELAEARRKSDFYRQRGVEAEILDERGILEAEPNLREGLAGGMLVPGDSVVYQPRAARHFLETAESVQLFERQEVAGLGDGRFRLADGTLVEADAVVVAAGIDSGELFSNLGLRRKKGHLVVTERAPGFLRHQIVELGYLKSAHSGLADSVAFNVQPRHTEQILIGSSRQFDVADPAVDRGILARMLRRAFEFMPGLRRLPAVRVWTGFRPATADNLPLIGRHPDLDRVFLATGHEGLGITTSTGTAAIIADLIAGRTPAIDAAPFDPARIARSVSQC